MYLEKSKRTKMKEVIKLSRSKLMALQLTNSIQKTGGLLVQNIPPT